MDGIKYIMGLNRRDNRRLLKIINLNIKCSIRFLIEQKQLDITWVKIKGHSNNTGNDKVDELAKEALAKLWDH